jgi:DNA-binding LacI/PurR family transcriptional regulator
MDKSEIVYRYCLKQVERCTDGSTKLESEWKLAKRFDVSRRSARFVLQRLVREGFATAQHGRGYFAVPRALKRPVKDGSRCVGVVYNKWQPEYQVQVHEHVVSLVTTALERQGLETEPIPVFRANTRVTSDRPVDAYVLISLTPAAQLEFSHQKLPVVVLGPTYEDLQISNVYLETLDITRDLCERFFDAGHRRIALMQYRLRDLAHERMQFGFELAHRYRQIRFRRRSIIRFTVSPQGLKDCYRELRSQPITALLVANRDLLGYVWQHAPEDIRKQLEDIEIAEVTEGVADTYPLPYLRVKLNFPAAARMVARMLKDTLDGRQGKPLARRIPWQTVEFAGNKLRG